MMPHVVYPSALSSRAASTPTKAVAKAGAWVQDQIPGVEEPFIKPWMIDLADATTRSISRAHVSSWAGRLGTRPTSPLIRKALPIESSRACFLGLIPRAPRPRPVERLSASRVPPGASYLLERKRAGQHVLKRVYKESWDEASLPSFW
jgi:hypothetical protein